MNPDSLSDPTVDSTIAVNAVRSTVDNEVYVQLVSSDEDFGLLLTPDQATALAGHMAACAQRIQAGEIEA